MELIKNDVWRQSATVRALTAGDTDSGDGELIENITGGPTHLEWTQTGTDGRAVVYLETGGTLSYDRIVALRADRWIGETLNINKYTTFASSVTASVFPSFNETLVGTNSDAWVYTASSGSNLEGIGLELEGTYTKKVNKVFFGTAVDLGEPLRVLRQISPRNQVSIKNGQAYHVAETVTIEFDSLTASELDAIEEALGDEQPFFLYDSDGNRLPEKLIYCIELRHQVEQRMNDLFTLVLQVEKLKEYTY